MTRWTKNQLIRAVAQAAAQRLCRRAISRLQKMRTTLSSDDSGLRTTWDEICAQVQGDQSLFWDAYEETIRGALAFDVAELPVHEQQALWLQTREGEDWDFKFEEDDREEPPVFQDDIVEYVMRDHLLIEAERWSNARIRAFLARASLRD